MAVLSLDYEPCIGIHLPEPRPGRTAIRWYPTRSPYERVRVRAYTCHCEPMIYELCQIGGQRFIRRARKNGSIPILEETSRGSALRTQLLWDCLLAGNAR
ncbi:hypothetical protein ACIBK9_22660 [Nonomuraea sp. NPDC050227]|uniref:hypothetical protein n=1 Tax=Nonomuraea sp. NPDC050227 TaxID=3364360 RepID=UPI00379CCC15